MASEAEPNGEKAGEMKPGKRTGRGLYTPPSTLDNVLGVGLMVVVFGFPLLWIFYRSASFRTFVLIVGIIATIGWLMRWSEQRGRELERMERTTRRFDDSLPGDE